MFWNVFYDECRKNGTSPNAVCKAIGLSNAAATGWKNGTMPKADVLVKLADELHCSVDHLLGREPEPIEADRAALTAILQQLPESDIDELIRHAELLLLRRKVQADTKDQ